MRSLGIVLALSLLSCDARFKAAQQKQAQIDVQALASAAEVYRVDHSKEPCPTVEKLRTTNTISEASKLTDPWDTTYRLVCTDTDVTATSAGPDKTFGTADDVSSPKH